MAELQKIDIVEGEGAEARAGNVVVHYTGWLHDPSKQDGHGRRRHADGETSPQPVRHPDAASGHGARRPERLEIQGQV